MIRVICPDMMCFWVDATTLEPIGTAVYDAYAFSDPLPGPAMTLSEWNDRTNG